MTRNSPLPRHTNSADAMRAISTEERYIEVLPAIVSGVAIQARAIGVLLNYISYGGLPHYTKILLWVFCQSHFATTSSCAHGNTQNFFFYKSSTLYWKKIKIKRTYGATFVSIHRTITPKHYDITAMAPQKKRANKISSRWFPCGRPILPVHDPRIKPLSSMKYINWSLPVLVPTGDVRPLFLLFLFHF